VAAVSTRPALPCVLVLAALAPAVWAQGAWLPAAQTQAVVIVTQAAQALAPQGARIQVLPGALDPRLQLAPCDKVRAFAPGGSAAWGRVRVGLKCEAGTVAWQVYLPLDVKVWVPAVVVRAALPAGAKLEAAQLSTAEVDWSAGSSQPLVAPGELEGRVLNRPLAAGQAVRTMDLRPRQWFAAGETVQIVAQGSGFAVSGEGTALAPGVEGQPARVRTDSGRIVVAQPVGPRRVVLAL
jgi:flagellar basal body P-ring formation protein FlgA